MKKQLAVIFVMCSLLFGVTALNQSALASDKCDVKTAEKALEAAKKTGSKKIIEKAQKDLAKAKVCQVIEDAKKTKENKIDQKKYDECMKVIPPGSYTYTKEWHEQYCKKIAKK